jgi:hypothetical protein
MLTLVKPHEREVANSMSLFVQMLFGYIPSPYVYGLVQDFTFIGGKSLNPEPGKEDLIVNRSTWGIKFLVFSTVIGFTALVIAIIAKRDTKADPEDRVATKEKTTTSSKTKVPEKLLSSKGNKPDMFADQVLEERSVDGSLASNPDDQQDGEGKDTRRWARSRKPKKAKVDIGTELDSETLRS